MKYSEQQNTQTLVVSVANALVIESGLLDWVGDTASKVAVAFCVAVVSGFGYQLGRLAYRKLRGVKEDRGDDGA